MHDMHERLQPMDAINLIKSLEEYRTDVESGSFPAKENSFSMNEEELKKLREALGS